MKKIVLSLLAIVGIFFLAGCGCEKIEYEVTFSNDGARTVVVVDKDSTVEKPSDPVKEGYVFLGWFKSLADTEAYDFSSKVTGNLTLYAKWVKESTACTLTCNEGYTLDNTNCTCVKDEVEKPEEEQPVVSEKFTVKFDADNGSKVTTKTVTSGNKVSAPKAPTKDGYKFVGWYLNNKSYNFNNKVTKNITLVAKWEKIVVEEPKDETPTTPETPTVKDPVLSYRLDSVDGSVVGQVRLYLTKDGVVVSGNADIITVSGKTVNKDIPKEGYVTNGGIIDKVINIKVD